MLGLSARRDAQVNRRSRRGRRSVDWLCAGRCSPRPSAGHSPCSAYRSCFPSPSQRLARPVSCLSASTICGCITAHRSVVGRIMQAAAVPVGMSWMWTLAFGHHEDRTSAHGCRNARGRDGGVRQELAAGVVLRSGGVCRQSISDSWLGNLRECLAHLVEGSGCDCLLMQAASLLDGFSFDCDGATIDPAEFT